MTKTFAAQNSKQTYVITIKNVDGMTDQQVLDFINKSHPTMKYTKITNMKGKHICQYCGEIVDGTDQDRLCNRCRETFGHSFYSEL